MLLRRLALVAPIALLVASGALAEAPNPDIKGLWLTTPYPVVTVAGGEETKIPISLVNYNVPPLRADMSLKSAPAGWTVELRGENRKVAAAFVDVNEKRTFDLDVKVPADTKPGKYEIALEATGGGNDLNLPITIEVVAPKAAELTVEPKLPVLRGTAKSNFEFQVR